MSFGRSRWIALWALAVLAVVLPGCGGGSGNGTPSGPNAAAPSPTPTPDLGPPNVVVVVADDMGWGDLGSYGNTQIKTPNLDRMASEGVRFTSFYVESPICAPSRAALLTGRWPPRTGIVWNPPNRLHDDEVVLARPLKERGYATALIGKWHLGWPPNDLPISHGFDYFYGIPSGEDESDFYLNGSPTRDTVSPDQFARRYTQEALKFIGNAIGPNKTNRFFVYIGHRDPHLENTPDPAFVGHSGNGAYGDTIEALDFQMGELAKGLKDLGVDQNTLVVFLSDNGPAKPPGNTGPFNGAKFSCEEGGIRVPAIMRWPARIRSGRVVDEIVSTLDIYPTLVAFTGATLPARRYDGEDISRLVVGDVSRIGGRGIDGGRELVFWQQYGWPGGLRSGRYKYLRPGLWNTSPTLFDLEADPGERNDLTKTRPDLSKQMEDRLKQILAEAG